MDWGGGALYAICLLLIAAAGGLMARLRDVIIVNDIKKAMSLIAMEFYGNPICRKFGLVTIVMLLLA